jgi:hypothetical protein
MYILIVLICLGNLFRIEKLNLGHRLFELL